MFRMTRRPTALLPVVALAFLAGCGDASPPAAGTTTRTGPSSHYTMDEFMKTTSISGGSFNHDNTKLLVSSNESGVFNVYELDLATKKRTAVTEGDDTTFGVAYMPADDRILFTRDNAGDEINHLFLRDLDGTVQELTAGAGTKEQFWGFSDDLAHFFTTNNARDERYMDLYVWDVATLENRMLYRNDVGMVPAAVSTDLRWVALGKSNSTNDSDLFLVDLEAGTEPRLISAHEGMASFGAEAFDPGSRWLYYTSNADGEFMKLRRYEMATGTHEDVYAGAWDVSAAYFSRSGAYRVIATNEDGYTKVEVTQNGAAVSMAGLPAGTVSGISFSHDETLMKLTVSSDTMPGNIFVRDLRSGETHQLTDTLNPEIDAEDLVTSTVARFAARDGLVIPGPLYKPIGAGPEHKVPVVLWIHGGPGGQTRPGYSAERQFLLNNGYAVFGVNNRGSSGYGKSFLAADDGRHGREPLWDCVDAKEWLKTQDWVDPDRIAILGGSYGGYMTLAALAFQPGEFACGVDIFGVANWIRTLENIPPWWESFREALYQEIGDPEKDREFLHMTSPVFHGDRIREPLMVLQGANDPRVLKAESDDMVQAIMDNGGTVEYVVFDDEGHGFRKSANRIEGWNRILAFLDTHLKGPVAAGPAAH
ncbi:S9 family peptidase [bacterium]|nr:S9 family peptidase [bacterium]